MPVACQEKLEAVDPVRKALALRNPIRSDQTFEDDDSQSDSELDLSDDEDDPYLQQLKRERIQQLKQQFLSGQNQHTPSRQVYPTLILDFENKATNELKCWVKQSRETIWARWNVLHLTAQGSNTSEEVDEVIRLSKSTPLSALVVDNLCQNYREYASQP